MIQLSLSLNDPGPVPVLASVRSRRKKRTKVTGATTHLFPDVKSRNEWADHLKCVHGYRYVSFEWQLEPFCFTTGVGERVMQFEKRDKETGEILRPEVRAERPKVVWVEPEEEEVN